MRGPVLAALALLGALRAAHAQAPSPYVPLDHWGSAYVEHLIARGVLADPAPLTRPLAAADLVRALEAARDAGLTAADRRVVDRLIADLARPAESPWGRVDAHLGVAAATHARRDELRPAGPGHATVAGGLALELAAGPVMLATHPYFDTRLKWDPDYEGKQDRVVAGRNAGAYAAARWAWGELFFGSLDRNWGPSALEGLLVSGAPYGYDHFALDVGTRTVRIAGLITQLDEFTDGAGVVHRRHWVAHRLVLRPSRRTTVALWEGSLVAGPGRALEPWFANILTLGLLAQYDQGSAQNSLVGADVETLIGRAALFGSLLLDDIQVDDDTPGDREPPAYGVTVGARGPAGRASWVALYTRVSNLAYRTPNPAETVMRRGVGLARNFADYDQLTVRGAALVGPGLLVSPEVALVRQGEGDFRLPYPPVAAYDTTPTFLAGTVERTVRLAVDLRLPAGRWHLSGAGGVHLVANAGHVGGAKDARFVGRVGVTYRYAREGRVP